MGEIGVESASVLGDYVEDLVVLHPFHADTCLLIMDTLAYLHSFNADNLKYVQDKAFCYNKSKFGIADGSALVVKSKGTRKNGF